MFFADANLPKVADEVLAELRSPLPAVVAVLDLHDETLSPVYRGFFLREQVQQPAPPVQLSEDSEAGKQLAVAPRTGGTQTEVSQKPVVAIVDHFYPGDASFKSAEERETHIHLSDGIDVDGDGERDAFYHGDAVEVYAGGDEIDARHYPITVERDARVQLIEQLDRVLTDLQDNTKIDALVFSWEHSILASSFKEELSLHRREHYKNTVAEWAKTNDSFRPALEIIDRLEKIAAAGVQVYTISGNAGARWINLYSLAKGVTTVGGSEADSQGLWINTNNPFVNASAKSANLVRPVHAKDGRLLGFDLNGDGTVDVDEADVSSVIDRKAGRDETSSIVLKGSSFAAPQRFRDVWKARLKALVEKGTDLVKR